MDEHYYITPNNAIVMSLGAVQRGWAYSRARATAANWCRFRRVPFDCRFIAAGTMRGPLSFRSIGRGVLRLPCFITKIQTHLARGAP